eukprot:2263676-Amphidinium_carterae.1
MRTAIAGVPSFWDLDVVERNTVGLNDSGGMCGSLKTLQTLTKFKLPSSASFCTPVPRINLHRLRLVLTNHPSILPHIARPCVGV